MQNQLVATRRSYLHGAATLLDIKTSKPFGSHLKHLDFKCWFKCTQQSYRHGSGPVITFRLKRHHGPYMFPKTKGHQQEIPQMDLDPGNTQGHPISGKDNYRSRPQSLPPLMFCIGASLKFHLIQVLHREQRAATPPQLHILFMPVSLSMSLHLVHWKPCWLLCPLLSCPVHLSW